VSPERIREVRRAAEVRVLRAGVSAHMVGEIIEIDYGAARARVTRSITRLPTEREADVFRDGLGWPGSVIGVQRRPRRVPLEQVRPRTGLMREDRSGTIC
jgi:hypothetical protein